LEVNGVRFRLSARKARTLAQDLVEAAEAAISDEVLIAWLRQRGIIDVDQQRQALLDMREMRQGTRGPSWPT
jgi:hypothetical protein